MADLEQAQARIAVLEAENGRLRAAIVEWRAVKNKYSGSTGDEADSQVHRVERKLRATLTPRSREVMAEAERRFPIQCSHHYTDRCKYTLSVPWPVAEMAYEVYASKYGREQSLEQLAERAGFAETELIWLLSGGRDT